MGASVASVVVVDASGASEPFAAASAVPVHADPDPVVIPALVPFVPSGPSVASAAAEPSSGEPWTDGAFVEGASTEEASLGEAYAAEA